MNPEVKNLITIVVTATVMAIAQWAVQHGYLKADVEAAVATGVQQITAQTDAQTEQLTAENKAEARLTRKKVVEETNEVSATAEKVATELVEAVPMRAQATDPAIAELLLSLQDRLDKLESGKVAP